MARSLFFTWKNGRGPDWTRRARVYSATPPQEWRVAIEDKYHRINIYVADHDEAIEVVKQLEAGESAIDIARNREGRFSAP